MDTYARENTATLKAIRNTSPEVYKVQRTEMDARHKKS